MSQDLLIGFIGFAVVMFFTPGPNNIMLLTSGLNFGFRRTVPHIAGVAFGFAFMIAVTGLGLGAVFTAYPMLQVVLKYIGAAYLVYLAVVIARAGPPESGAAERRRPMTFLGAALFQWVNVKGWVMAIGTITAYAAIASYPWNILLQTGLSLLLGVLSAVTWAWSGTALQTLVKSPRAVRAFNLAMGLLLLASLYPVLREP
ncbi:MULTISPECIES: LysE family translocator [Rhodopseudomonas]|uniref:Lysine transporter LysE n=1 Tax=Rhodopseudomonas palustris TaxID=1076 RepID=A0A0D7E4J1_RHOPL|nr:MULTISPECIES: LysE family translocator [Rhodopseudomonas]KIZ34512.1 lysine transporter LysE [Rhodopseudomonas palustris]MDF3808707.1 LysE family translocator [Rhodopseudomonas sp. BAL398]WOK19771.1 LysE family translocator [Rhodopseudomonas sp. BAL398]